MFLFYVTFETTFERVSCLEAKVVSAKLVENKMYMGECITYVSVVVQLIVSEFQLIEGNWLLHPVSSTRGAVRVYVNPRG